MATALLRRYSISDANMLGVANNFASAYATHHSSFTQLDSGTFGEHFPTVFQAAITAAEKMPSDDVLIDQQVKEGEDVENVKRECLNEVSMARYYINKAFKGRESIINQFGYNDLEGARKSTNKLVLFMEDFSQKIEEHSALLVENKFPAEKVQQIAFLTRELKRERQEYQGAKDYRANATDQRIKLLNHVWDIMVLINDAAAYCLSSNQIAREQFALPSPQSTDKKTDELELEELSV